MNNLGARLGDKVPGFVPKEVKPSVYLSSKQIPDIKEWQPGQTYRVLLTVRQTNLSVGDDVGADFEIIGAKALNAQRPPHNTQKRNKSAMMKALSKKAQY